MSIVNIFINGKECKADTEKTLLDNILDNGINLPHLCHRKLWWLWSLSCDG